MTIVRQVFLRLTSLFRKRELDRDFDTEMAAHIELATDDYVQRGLGTTEARRLALMKVGGIEASKDGHRDARGVPWLDGVSQDIRYALRALRRSPGFAFTAIAMLAISIGINAAVFTVTDAVIFRGFPLVERNDRLLYMASLEGCCVSYPAFLDWRGQAKSFQDMAIVHGIQVRLTDANGFATPYDGTEVSANTFRLVGRRPILGRDFTHADEAVGAPPRVAILHYDFWQSRFAGDPAIVGRVVRVNGEPTTLIGVMPRGFSFPQKLEMWTPLIPTPSVMKRDARDTWVVVARLAEGVTEADARAEMKLIGKRLGDAYPDTDKDFPPIVMTFPEFFLGKNSTLLYASMWGAVGFVLLIACANLANLMLSRAAGRTREMTLRIALGAGRWRIIRQLLAESLILSGLGGVAGWWIAKGALALYVAMQASGISWLIADYRMDYRVLLYLTVISIGTGILFGLAPAIRLSKFDVNATLKEGAQGAIGGERGKRIAAFLVMVEMGLAVVLLSGAGVLVRSFLNLYRADLGVKVDNVLSFSPEPPANRVMNPGAWSLLNDRIRARISAIPGIESVSYASRLPGGDAFPVSYELDDSPVVNSPRSPRRVPLLIAAPSYFKILGATVLSGREFNAADMPASVPVAMVNQQFAHQHWPGQNPLGKRVRLLDPRPRTPTDPVRPPETWRTVVGVVSNIVQNGAQRLESTPLLYLPDRQRAGGRMWFIARTQVDPDSLVSAVRRDIQALDPELTVWSPGPLGDDFKFLYWNSQFYGTLFLTFAVIALLMASIGLYAVMAHSVSQRTKEIGVRMAIGGAAEDIRRLVFREGMLPVAVGLFMGLAAALGVNRLLQSQLVGVEPHDPVTLAAAPAVLVLVALLGCLIPARRAMRVDPAVALRHD